MATLSSLTPNSKPVGSPSFVLTATGSGFIHRTGGTIDDPTYAYPDVIEFNGNEYQIDPTTASGNSVSATIPASELTVAGTYSVRVILDDLTASNSVSFSVTATVPTLTSVSPTSIAAGGSAQITCNGTSFTASSVVRVDGVDQTTTFVSSTQIKTTGSYAFSAIGKIQTVTVNTPGVGESGGQSITVNNPVPTMSNISPASVNVGDPTFTMTITGTGFNGSTRAAISGSFRDTVVVSSTTLHVTILNTDLGSAGSPVIGVVNPSPGGATIRNDQAPNITAFTINNPVPVIDSISPSSVMSGSGATTITVTGSLFVSGTGASVVKWNGVAQTTTFVSGNQLTFAATQTMLAQAGTATVTVFNGGPGGGTSNSKTFNITGGTPNLNSITPSTVPANSTTGIILAGSNFSTSFTVRINGASVAANWINSTRIDVTVTPSMVPTAGDYTVTVTNNGAGGGTSQTRHLTATNPAPTLTSLSTTTKTVGDAAFTLTLTGTGFISGASSGTVSGAARTTTFVSSTSLQIAITASDLATGGTLAIGVTNASPGGGSSSTINLTVNYPVPTVSSFDSNTIVIGSPDTTVVINGTGFGTGSQVKIGATNLTTTYVSSIKLQAVVPASSLTTITTLSLTVTNPTPGGGTVSCPTLSVVNPVPAISSLSPANVNAGSAAFDLTITGTGFRSGVSSAYINGSARTTTFNSSTQLTMAVNANDVTAAGTLNVTVVNTGPGGGSSAPAPFYVGSVNPVPTLTSISPSTRNAGDPGPVVTVTGTNFLTSSVVRWEGADRPTTYVDATHLTVQLQNGDLALPGTYNITVFNPAPGGGLSGANGFVVVAVNPAPQVTSVSPASATTGGGSFTLTINGAQFIATSTVRITDAVGGVTNPTPTFVNSTTLTVTVASSAIVNAGSVTVQVTNPTPGGGSASTTFTVGSGNPVPTIASISPTTVNVGAAATTLTINGTGYIATSQVKANGTNLTTTFVSSTQVTATLTTTFTGTAGIVQITVTNPASGGGTSNVYAFNVLNTTNPVPSIDSLSPEQLLRGLATFVLAVFGKNFIPSSTAAFNGVNKTTTYVSPTRVDASIPAADIALATGGVARVNPNGHPESLSANAQNVRAFAAGSAEAPAMTIGPNATKTGWHAPEEHTWEWVANTISQMRLGPDGVETSDLAVYGDHDVHNSTGALMIINITSTGSSYSSIPTVTIGAPPPAGHQATAVAVLDGDGGVDHIVMVDSGEGYDPANPPSVTITGGGGTGAAATAVVTSGLMASVANGFIYIPTLNGQPNGVPPTKTGLAPMVLDTLHNKLWVYRGSWKGVGLT